MKRFQLRFLPRLRHYQFAALAVPDIILTTESVETIATSKTILRLERTGRIIDPGMYYFTVPAGSSLPKPHFLLYNQHRRLSPHGERSRHGEPHCPSAYNDYVIIDIGGHICRRVASLKVDITIMV